MPLCRLLSEKLKVLSLCAEIPSRCVSLFKFSFLCFSIHFLFPLRDKIYILILFPFSLLSFYVRLASPLIVTLLVFSVYLIIFAPKYLFPQSIILHLNFAINSNFKGGFSNSHYKTNFLLLFWLCGPTKSEPFGRILTRLALPKIYRRPINKKHLTIHNPHFATIIHGLPHSFPFSKSRHLRRITVAPLSSPLYSPRAQPT